MRRESLRQGSAELGAHVCLVGRQQVGVFGVSACRGQLLGLTPGCEHPRKRAQTCGSTPQISFSCVYGMVGTRVFPSVFLGGWGKGQFG